VRNLGPIGSGLRYLLFPAPNQGQFFVYLKKYQEFGFVLLIDILPALQGLQQFRILLFSGLGQKKAFAFVTGTFFNKQVTGLGI
jgi:hypothetical protein